MKVYRFIKWPDSSTKREEAQAKGIVNEGLNILNLGYMSPSNRYNYLNGCKSITLPNTFAAFQGEMCMTKYFFTSLSDTLSFLLEQKKLDGLRGYKFKYGIYAIDLPLDVVKQYIGAGFYGSNFSRSHIEVCLPYENLYNYLNNDEYNYAFFYALNLYNKSYHKYIKQDDIMTLMLDPSYPDKLSINGTNELYPYLCFKIENDYEIIKFLEHNSVNKAHNIALKLKEETRKNNYENTINTILERKPESLHFNPNYSQEDLFNYTMPIINEENEQLKLILSKKL